MAATIRDIRYELGDTDATFPLMSDAEITYFLAKNESNLRRTSLDCAKSLLFKLSIRSEDSTVDIFSISGSKAAKAYMDSLKMYIKNPDFNGSLTSVSGYAGGISKQDMQDNIDVYDNNAVITPGFSGSYTYPPLSNPFVV
jgi:hypothetical protein